MPQRHRRHTPYVVLTNYPATFKRRECTRGSHDRQLTAMPVDFQIDAELRNLREYRSVNRHFPQPRARPRDPLAQNFLILGVSVEKSLRVAIVRFASLDNLDSIIEISLSHNFGMQPKAIEQLRPQFAFLRIAGSDQHELGWMFDGDAFPLDSVSPRRGNVQQQIHQMI